ncbi:MAG TPA: DUF4232 domain-containing protein [Trebonia sp.]
MSSAPSGSTASSPTLAPASASATQPPATAATQAPTSSSGTSGGGTAQSDCTTDVLSAAVAGGEGAAGSDYVTIDFTNKGGISCSLDGYPGVSLDNSGGQIGAAATRDSSHGGPSEVTLAPGAKANVIVRVADAQNYSSSTCTPDSASFLKIYPPNNTAAIDVPYKSTGCRSGSVKLLTTTVVSSGAGSD